MTESIEVNINHVLDFLEKQFANPETRWGELRALLAKAKKDYKTTIIECPHCGVNITIDSDVFNKTAQ